MSEFVTRELLVASCHSDATAVQRIRSQLLSQEFVSLLVRIAVDEDGYEGDAPMQAAYFLSETSPEYTRPHESALLGLLTAANDGCAGHVALTLGQMQSSSARPIIESALQEGEFVGSWLYEKALAHYGC